MCFNNRIFSICVGALIPVKNRDYNVPRNDELIFAECPHCNEPLTYTKVERDSNANASINTYNDSKVRCYCRGADALSLAIGCCVILKCLAKKQSACNFIQPTKTEYAPSKNWNTIVVEPNANSN